MKRLRLSERDMMTVKPRRISSRQSSGRGSRATMASKLPAMDLMGVSELFSSWPSTRTRRCQACSSCSLNAWVRSAITSSSSGRPCSRIRVRRIPQRPTPPGNTVCRVVTAGPSRQTSRCNSAAVWPSRRSAGAASRRSPARFTRRKRWFSSKAKMATAISRITVRSRVVASMAPRRCSRSVLPRVLTSRMTSPRASSGRGERPRTEKSPSRNAPSRLEMVCKGNTTRSRAARANPSQAPEISTESVHCTLVEESPLHSIHRAMAEPGSPASSASRTTRPSWLSRAGLSLAFITGPQQAISLQPPVERAAAQAERVGGMADVAAESRQRLLDEQRLDIFEAHVFQSRRTLAPGAQPEVDGAHHLTLRHQHGPLHGVIQLAHVARPGVGQQRLDGGFVKPRQRLAVVFGMLAQKLAGQNRDILAPVAQRGQAELDGVQAEQQILTEPALGNFFRDLGIGRREYPHIHPPGLRRTHALELAGLQRAQQFGLQSL